MDKAKKRNRRIDKIAKNILLFTAILSALFIVLIIVIVALRGLDRFLEL